MNERILELFKQSTTVEDTYPAGCNGYPTKLYVFDKEKFAELIIEHATECVRDVLRDEDSPLTYEAADMIQKRIKQYFGV